MKIELLKSENFGNTATGALATVFNIDNSTRDIKRDEYGTYSVKVNKQWRHFDCYIDGAKWVFVTA